MHLRVMGSARSAVRVRADHILREGVSQAMLNAEMARTVIASEGNLPMDPQTRDRVAQAHDKRQQGFESLPHAAYSGRYANVRQLRRRSDVACRIPAVVARYVAQLVAGGSP